MWEKGGGKKQTRNLKEITYRPKKGVKQYTHLNMPMATINTAKELKLLQQVGAVRKDMPAKLLVLTQEDMTHYPS